MKLTKHALSEIVAQNPPAVEELNLSGREITHVDDISHYVNLHKLNLSNNKLSSSDSLSGIARNKGLTLLNLSKNSLDAVDFLKKLHSLSGNSILLSRIVCA
jgi:Leucine-rich repeat (LRR) protein